MFKTTDENKNSDFGLTFRKRLLKHVSAITSLSIVLFLSLLIFEDDILSIQIFNIFKVSNLFLLLFFTLSTLLSVLFTNKVRRENLYKEKNINFGLYFFLSGVMIINALLLYISFEDYYIFTFFNPYLLFIIGIVILVSGLYINYTYLDENIYNIMIVNKNYSLRAFGTISFILLYSLFNFYFGFYYVGLAITFWLDVIILEIIIPIIVYSIKIIYNVSRAIILFLISVPGIIFNFTVSMIKGVTSFIVNFTHSTITKSKTLNTSLHYSKKHLLTSILLSFGFSIILLQSSIILFFILLFQLLIGYGSLRDLNGLYSDIEHYAGETFVPKKSFYELYGIYLIAFMLFLEPLSYALESIFFINSMDLILLAISCILIATIIILLNPLKRLLYYLKKALISFLVEHYSLVRYDRVSVLKISLSSLGLIILSYQLYYSVQLFFSIFLSTFLLFLFSREHIKKLMTSPIENSDLTTPIHKEPIRLILKFYLSSLITLVLSLPVFLVLIVSNDIAFSNYMFLLSLALLILPNYRWIIHISKLIANIFYSILEKIFRILKSNLYIKPTFIYKINAENQIFGRIEILKLILNTFIFVLLIQIILPDLFKEIYFLVPVYILLLLMYFSKQAGYYNDVNSLLKMIDNKDESSSPFAILLKVKDLFRDFEEEKNHEIENYLIKHKYTTRTIVDIPACIGSNLFFLLIFDFALANFTSVVLALLSLMLVINYVIIFNVIKKVIISLALVIQSILQTIINITKVVGNFFISIMIGLYNIIKRLTEKLYSILFKNGNKTLSIDLALILIVYFIIGLLFLDQTSQFAIWFDLRLLLVVYVLGLLVIWHHIVSLFLQIVAYSIYNQIKSFAYSIYSILFKRGQYSYSIDSFVLLSIFYLLTIVTIGFDDTRTLGFVAVFLISLAIIWLNQVIMAVTKVILLIAVTLRKVAYITKQIIERMIISLKYFIMETINWSLFYVSILFSIIFILLGIVYVISGILNDSGAFIKTIFFDINLLFGLAGITNIILLLLGGGLIFAGLLLVRILNENKERLLLHVYAVPKVKKQFEVTK